MLGVGDPVFETMLPLLALAGMALALVAAMFLEREDHNFIFLKK